MALCESLRESNDLYEMQQDMRLSDRENGLKFTCRDTAFTDVLDVLRLSTGVIRVYDTWIQHKAIFRVKLAAR